MTTGLQGGNAWAQYDAFDPVLDNGTFKELKPGETKRIPLVRRPRPLRAQEQGAEGLDDRQPRRPNGRFQAELIPVGALPAS